ncbi:MAG: hypothetical protein CMK07_15885 [Ponticaulis sp.]|nr:hypothetical protein [Ponticaulis sp.]
MAKRKIQSSTPNGWVADLLIVVAIVCVLAIGGLVTGGSDDPWYAELTKPPFNPPDITFAIVWPVLYLFMAIAAILVRWNLGRMRYDGAAFGLFFMQLTFNLAWSILFFFMHRPVWAFLDLLALILTLIMTISHFGRHSAVAGWLLVPYLLWTFFAAYLNGMIIWLNDFPIPFLS